MKSILSPKCIKSSEQIKAVLRLGDNIKEYFKNLLQKYKVYFVL